MERRWSTVSVDPDNPPDFDAVSCGSATFCVAVTSSGQAFMYDGDNWTGQTIDGSNWIIDVSCPTASFCVAVDFDGNVLTYATAQGWSTQILFSSPGLLISCSSPEFCLAIGSEGQATFTGDDWSQPVAINIGPLVQLSCASPTFCAAVDSNGNAYTYDGATWDAATPLDPDLPPNYLRPIDVSCPTQSFCAAVDIDGNAFTYDGGTVSPVAITTTSLPGGAVGVSYSSSVGVRGGTEPYAWSITSGSLPTGLSIDPTTGLISGTPTAAGTAQFTVTVTDSTEPTNQSQSQPFSINVGSLVSPVVTLQPVSQTIRLGQGVSFTAAATGYPSPTVQWYYDTGAGTQLSPAPYTSDTLSYPVTEQMNGWQVEAVFTNAAGSATTDIATITILNAPSVTIAPSPLPASQGPVPYTVNVVGTGGPVTGSVEVADDQGDSCSISSLTAGPGDSGSGNCSVTESAAASPYTVTANYSGDPDNANNFALITVASDVANAQGEANVSNGGVTTTSAGGATGNDTITEVQYPTDPVGAPTFNASGQYFDEVLSSGNTFTSETMVDCNLNGGDSLRWWDPAANSGIGEWQAVLGDPGPTSTAGSPPCISVTLNNTTSPSLSQLTGTVFGAATGLNVTTTSLGAANSGERYSATLVASGGNPPYKWSLSGGKLPPGLHLRAATGAINGRPSRRDSGTYTFTVKVVDKKIKTKHHPPSQNSVTQVLSITVTSARAGGPRIHLGATGSSRDRTIPGVHRNHTVPSIHP